MSVDITIEEVMESLTGFDEIAIANHFGAEWMELAEKRPTAYSRALVFVHKRRQGLNDHEAKQAALEMPLRDVTSYFKEDEPEIFPDEPVTETGKDSAPSE